MAPAGQADVCKKVVAESAVLSVIAERMRAEYLAIVSMLCKMGVPFRITHANPEKIDLALATLCVNALGCRLVGFPASFFGPAIAYPRDFCSVLPNLLLISSEAVQRLTVSEKGGWKLRVSPYGEGGRVLIQGDTMIACERVIPEGGRAVLCPEEVAWLRGEGVKTGLFPMPLNVSFSSAGSESHAFFSNDHIDRVACLLKGRHGKLYLVIDPQLITADWAKPEKGRPWAIRGVEETRAHLQQTFGPMGIEVCWPDRMIIPYALNLAQFADGRVLMTGGDPQVQAVVGGIVGERNVFETPIPIRYFPAWANGGIHCLVSEAPAPLMIKQ